MAPIHFRLLVPLFNRLGYKVELLEQASKDDVEVGLKYVNNDACFPAIMVVGQLVNKIRSGEADPDRTSLAITQTGGMCRATNYAGMLRKGLRMLARSGARARHGAGLEARVQVTPALIHRGVRPRHR